MNINSTVTLTGGVKIPHLGFGVYRSPPTTTTHSVTCALQAGYRHIDTAQMYRNEAEVGAAIKVFEGVKREEVFITTKLMHDTAISEKLTESVNKINLDGYVDLFLIHSPLAGPQGRADQWKAMEALKKLGKTRAIGISNYGVRHMQEMRKYADETPAVNQIELHPWCQQPDIVRYCQDNNIAIEAYSPLVQGSKANDPTLISIANETGKNWAQVLIRWSLQRGFIPLPKSDTESRIQANADVFDFDLSEDQMARLNALNRDEHVCWNPTTCP